MYENSRSEDIIIILLIFHAKIMREAILYFLILPVLDPNRGQRTNGKAPYICNICVFRLKATLLVFPRYYIIMSDPSLFVWWVVLCHCAIGAHVSIAIGGRPLLAPETQRSSFPLIQSRSFRAEMSLAEAAEGLSQSALQTQEQVADSLSKGGYTEYQFIFILTVHAMHPHSQR